MAVLVVNAGSSSVKVAVFDAALREVLACRVTAIGGSAAGVGAGAGSVTSTGTSAVKTVPWPGWLVTRMSPPISWQNLRLIARPRPVPPYLRVVEASACTNAPKSFPTCSGVIPMPVSVTRNATQARPS
jgi:hypothetical protein